MNKHGRWRLAPVRGLGMAAALLALSGAALAQNFGRAAVWHHTASGLVQDLVSTGRAHAASTDSAFNGRDTRWSFIASAFADIDRGAVGASVIAEKSGPSGFFPLTVHTLSTVFETLTFSGPRPAEVEFTATITGSFAAAVESSNFLASSWLHFGGNDSTAEFSYTHRPLSPDREAQVRTSGTVSAVVDEISGLSATLHVRRTVNPGDTLPLQAEFALRVTPANDDIAVANFGHTVQLGYVLPPGFSFTSSSGTFMSLPPLPAVPEPATWLMGAAGVLMLAGQRARRSDGRGWRAYRRS